MNDIELSSTSSDDGGVDVSQWDFLDNKSKKNSPTKHGARPANSQPNKREFSMQIIDDSQLPSRFSLNMWECPIKVVSLGNSGVGKTMFADALRASRTEIIPSIKNVNKPPSTIGADWVVTRRVVRLDVCAHICMKMQIWDTAGQERYHSLLPQYLREAHAVLLFYDITDASSIADLERVWAPYYKTLHEANPALVVMIVGTKNDLAESLRQVSWETAHRCAKRLGSGRVLECSALERESVHKVADNLAIRLVIALRLADSPDVQRRLPKNQRKATADLTAINLKKTNGLRKPCGCTS